MKFRLREGKGSVSGFTDAEGVTHVPGEVVDLPPSYCGQHYLEAVDKRVEVPMEPVEIEVPLPAEKVESTKKPKGSKKTK